MYDAENRVTAAAGATYSYDGASLRVKKVAGGNTTVYIFAGAKVIAEYVNGAAVGSPTREYIYSGSALIATHEGGALKFHYHDHLSARVTSDSSGGNRTEQAHYPFGEEWYNSTGAKLLFTSYERDSESGNDYAIFRHHVVRLGRFNSSDLLAGSIGDPQSLNRYAYVMNDPVNLVDPLGLSPAELATTVQLLPGDAWDGWGGSGGGSCTLNGQDIPCGFLARGWASGAFEQCPDNRCGVRTIIHGTPVYADGTYTVTEVWQWNNGQSKTPNCGEVDICADWVPSYIVQFAQGSSSTRGCGWDAACHFFVGFGEFILNDRPSGLLQMGGAVVASAGAVGVVGRVVSGTRWMQNARGFETTLTRNFRVGWHRFPFGGRIVNRPHYHLRPRGGAGPGQGIGNHRPWEGGWWP